MYVREGEGGREGHVEIENVCSHLQSAGKKGKTSFVPYRDSILTWLLKVLTLSLLIVAITSCMCIYI